MSLFSKTYWNHLATDYVLLSWLFLRGLALIYFSAFSSMSVQIEGLIGSNGILPVVDKLALIEQLYPQQKFWILPTLFWFNASDIMLRFSCYAGMAASLFVLFNRYSRLALIVCFILYLSIVEAGQVFTQFQWDVFLLEVGFLAIFLTWGSAVVVLLFRWLLARFMFMGGLVKLASGDPTWSNFSALSYHYETQPLPSSIAYYVHHLPLWFHKICVGGVFFIELLLPFCVFLPRRFRLFACAGFVLLQSAIILTGNYTFFNLLTIFLCLFLLQDKDIKYIFSNKLCHSIYIRHVVPGFCATFCATIWAVIVLLICICYIWIYNVDRVSVQPFKSLLRTVSSFSLVNNYGPFPVMTRNRNEIIVQGSNDGKQWLDYEFKYKPGQINREFAWNIPHQPRLDWQMWFAALAQAQKPSWFENFLNKIQQGSPQVLELLENPPFPDKPPLYMRAKLYRYSYTSLQQRKISGDLWQRHYIDIYWPTQVAKPTLLIQKMENTR